MIALTVQPYAIFKQIFSPSGYTPLFWKSIYAFTSPEYTKGYRYILEELSKKTGRVYNSIDISCMWCWIGVPFLGFFSYRASIAKDLSDRLYAAVVDIPDSELVYSDYDLFCDYLEGSKDTNFFVNSSDLKNHECIQGACWNIEPSWIRYIVDLCFISDLDGKSLKSMIPKIRDRDERYLFDSNIDTAYIPDVA